MKILYAASEVAPFIKTGGLGDVAGSLPKALAAKGHEVAVICPLYCQIKPEWRDKMYYLRNLYVQVAWRSQYCGIFVYESDGVKYYFLDNEYYFARNSVYGEYDDAERFAFFSRAILEMLPAIDFHPDVINCNDWQTALVPVYYGLDYNCRFTTSSSRVSTAAKFWTTFWALMTITSRTALCSRTAMST